MTKNSKEFNPQQQNSTPSAVDEVAQHKQQAQEHEVAGRHKQDGQDDHKGNRRQAGTPSGQTRMSE
jgi:hypothetical protein